MRILKISLFILLIASLASCLKPKNDFAGTREDEGSIVISIMERQYINVDAQNLQLGYNVNFANLSFTTPNEPVLFFTVHVAQLRKNKLTGPLVLQMQTTSMSGFDPLPAGALNVTSITVPQSSADAFDFPVLIPVNKAVLNPNGSYGVTFKLTGTSQGVISAGDASIDVVFNQSASYNSSRATGRYVGITTIRDSANLYTATNNTRPMLLLENVASSVDPLDLQFYAVGSTAYGLRAINTTLSGNASLVVLLQPRYVFDANGKVIDVRTRAGVSLNPVFDVSSPNQFVYTSNNQRTLQVKYTVRLTFSGLTRPFTITDSYTYDPIQVGFY